MHSNQCLFCNKPTKNIFCDPICKIAFSNLPIEQLWDTLVHIRWRIASHYKKGEYGEASLLDESEDVIHKIIIKRVGSESKFLQHLEDRNNGLQQTQRGTGKQSTSIHSQS